MLAHSKPQDKLKATANCPCSQHQFQLGSHTIDPFPDSIHFGSTNCSLAAYITLYAFLTVPSLTPAASPTSFADFPFPINQLTKNIPAAAILIGDLPANVPASAIRLANSTHVACTLAGNCNRLQNRIIKSDAFVDEVGVYCNSVGFRGAAVGFILGISDPFAAALF